MSKMYERTNVLSGDTIDADLPARWLINSIVVNRDNSMGIGWRVMLPYLPTWEEDEKRSFHGAFRAMLNSLPDGFDLQVIFSQNHDGAAIDAGIKHNLPTQPILREIIETQADMVREGFRKERLRYLEGYVILVAKNRIGRALMAKRAAKNLKDDKETGLFERLIARAKIALFGANEGVQYEKEEYLKARAELLGMAESIETGLAAMQLSPETLSNDDVLNLLYRHWNPKSYDEGSRARPYRPGETLPITDYFIRSPWRLRDDGLFESDGQFHGVVTLRTPPESMRFTQWDSLLLASGLTKMKLVVNIKKGDLVARKKHLKDKMPLYESQAQKDPTFRQAYEDIVAELENLGRDIEKVWLATHVLHLWGDTPELVQRAIREVKKYGEANDGLILTEETHATWEYWRACQPFWTRDFDDHREHTYNTSQLVTQLPLVGQETAIGSRIGAVFETTSGSVFNLHFHSDDYNNYNVLVIGGSGTGKSFLVNNIIAQYSRNRPKTIIVDLGGSFRGMCIAQGGSYIDMDIKNAGNRMNPLFATSGGMVDEDQLDAMTLFIEKLVVDPVKEGRLTKELKDTVEKALVQTITRAEGKEIYLSDLKETLSNFSNGGFLATRLAQWTGTGRYAKLFDGPSMLDTSNNYVVFDLSKVRDNPDLCSVMFATIIQQVMALGQRAPGDKFLVFDEAWNMLEDEIIASFIVMAFRALRKGGFSTIAISQGVEEFTRTKNKTAIVNNLSHLIILRQNTENAAQQVAVEFQLSAAEAAIISQLQSRKGQFSQSLIIQKLGNGRKRSVITLNRPSPLAYWCCTTHPAEKAIIEEYRNRGMGHMDAIKLLAKEYPAGFSQGAAKAA